MVVEDGVRRSGPRPGRYASRGLQLSRSYQKFAKSRRQDEFCEHFAEGPANLFRPVLVGRSREWWARGSYLCIFVGACGLLIAVWAGISNSDNGAIIFGVAGVFFLIIGIAARKPADQLENAQAAWD